MKYKRAFIICLAATALAMLGLVTTAHAQVITTSPLSGIVLSEQEKPVAGVTVVVTHRPTGVSYTATTRENGTFALRGLRPGGPYSVTIDAGGLGSYANHDVQLEIEAGANITARLATNEVVQMETYQVAADPLDTLFDPNQTGQSTILGSETIRNTPLGDRSINSLARLDPRINYNGDPNDRAISASGMNNRYNSIQVDGVSASDPFGLNGNNTAAERNVIPVDAIDSMQISTSPYGVRNAGFVGAQINAVTKSGGNDFSGSLYATYRAGKTLGISTVAQTLDGNPAPIPQFIERTFGASLGGPIVPRRLFFFVNYEKVNENRIPPSPTTPISETDLAAIIDGAQKLGFAPGDPNPPAANKLKDDSIIAKLDWQINAAHRATFRFNQVNSTRPTFPGFGSGSGKNNFSLSSAWFDQETKNTAYIGQLISHWSDKLNTEFSLSKSKYHSEPRNNSDQPYVRIQYVPVPDSSDSAFVTFGTEYSRHSNRLNVNTYNTEFFATYELAPRHTLQAGLQYDQSDVSNLYVQYSKGYYDFSSLDQFLALAQTNDGTLNYYEYRYFEILPGINPAAEFKEGNLGLFISDTWQILDTLKADIGLRLDRAMLPDKVPFNQAFFDSFGRRNDYTYDGKTILQPRVGFNWRPALQKRTIIRGGIGLFYGRMPAVWMSNSYSNTGMNYQGHFAGTNYRVNGKETQAPRIESDPANQSATGGAPAQNIAFVDQGFRLPARWKGNIAIERDIGLWDIKASIEYEKTMVDKDVLYQNLNLQPAATSTADGRQLFWSTMRAVSYDPASRRWNSSSGTNLRDTAFSNRTIMLTNTSKGGTDTLTLALERPYKKDGWYWKASYTYTDAREVQYAPSSVAASNWQNRTILNPGEDRVQRATLEIRDRILVNISKSIEFAKNYKTTFSVIYNGHSGLPYSLVYANDLNGDGVSRNDTFYVPIMSGDANVRFEDTRDSKGNITQTAAEAQTLLRQIINRHQLKEGTVAGINSQKYPWVNQFDISIKQEIKLPGWRHKLTLGVDILNFGNLLNSKWGLICGSNQYYVRSESVATVYYDGIANQYVYTNINKELAGGRFAPSTGRGEPAATRWSMLFSAKYEF